ncbi:MAG: hypothetical protein DI629_21275 [Mesorhizobium amorphae]|nr:MAG: hypothetical protein DI629_21275 [Mesorhizobium amorphae]
MNASRLTLSDFVLERQDTLLHLGTLDPSRRRAASHEGDCLSASLSAGSWRRIARLGGEPTLLLTRPGALYLNPLASPGVIARATGEAVADGLMMQIPLFKVWGESEDGRFFMFFESEEEARREADLDDEDPFEDPDGEGGGVIEITTGFVLTEEGRAVLGPRFSAEAAFAEDAAIMLAAIRLSETEPDLCGVFWNEADAPERLSAPRFAILPGRLPEFRVRGPERSAPFEDYVREGLSEEPAP